jgi:hypothetical protein
MQRTALLLILLLLFSSACKDPTGPAPVPSALEITPVTVLEGM